MRITMQPIGFVRGGRIEPTDDEWDQETASIELDASRFGPDALLSLNAFSHAEIIFWFHHPEAETPHLGARRPR